MDAVPGADRDAAARRADADAETVRRHAERVRRRWPDLGRRRTLLERAVRTRAEDRRLPDFETVDDGRGSLLLVASGQLLVRAEDLKGRESELPAGVRAEPILGGRVFRLTFPPARRRAIEERAELRRGGLPVEPAYVTAMAVVIKSQGGAERASSRWPEPDVVMAAEARVRVAVVDTGLTAVPRQDAWLKGLARPEHTDGPTDPGNIDLLDVSPHNQLLDAAGGHGTAVAGLVQHEAPGVPLVVYNPIPSDGGAAETDVAAAMVRAVRDGLDAGQSVVLNLSLGTDTVDDEPPLALVAALEEIEQLAAASEHEVLVVAAAGNFGDDRPVWPAVGRGVVAVGAVDRDGARAPWSSYGDWVDCSVVGDGVLSVYVVGREDPDLVGEAGDRFDGPDPFALHFGTSFAAPQVAGRVARVAQRDGLGLTAALDAVLATAERSEPGLGKVLPAVHPD